MRKFLIAAAAAAVCVLAPGAASAQTYPLTAACVLQAAQLQSVPPHILLGLLKTEGGRVGGERTNRNGSKDLGPMQINDRTWIPQLARMHFGGDREATFAALRDHGCYNMHIGAWIFRQYLDEAKGNYAEAVGFYNSHNEAPKRAYQARFAQNFMQLFGGVAGAR